MDHLARAYVVLVRDLDAHVPGYVDAVYGPAAEIAADDPVPSLGEIARRARELCAQIEAFRATLPDLRGSLGSELRTDEVALQWLRVLYLSKQTVAVAALAEARSDPANALSFDEEARLLYDASPPTHTEEYYTKIIQRLEGLLPPGPGETLIERFAHFKEGFVIPPDRLMAVFSAAIAEARRITKERVQVQHYILLFFDLALFSRSFISFSISLFSHFMLYFIRSSLHSIFVHSIIVSRQLPEGESFEVRCVTDKPWSAYNWYRGNYHSLIEVNSELPIFIDRAFDLAAHEGMRLKESKWSTTRNPTPSRR